MKHYCLILLMTWTAMLFILFASWGLLLTGMDMGDFTIFMPIMFAISGVALLSRSDWFDENIRQPLAETLEFGNFVEVIIHLQLFTLICGVLGLGLGIAALTAFYPMGIEMFVKGMAVKNQDWHNFSKYTPMSVLSGFTFGMLLYSYLFADARQNRWATRAILIGGFLVFFILGLLFGSDRFYFVFS